MKKKREPIGEVEVRNALTVMENYKRGKSALEARITTNERWWKMQHWAQMRDPKDVPPTSAWMFNALATKHADAMDNYPMPNVLPREESDMPTAEQLSKILPVLLEYTEFPQTYSDAWWYKIKMGTCVYEVVWDNEAENGLGQVDIRKVDLLNLFWEPGVTDIQKSANIFHVELHDKSELEKIYPGVDFNVSASLIAKYAHDDTVDTSDKVMVIDWYYKKYENGKPVLHFCKFAGSNVLRSTENEGTVAYEHGLYPFVFDVLYAEEDTAIGFGFIDIMKDCQTYIDKLDNAILKNAIKASKKKVLARTDGGINIAELIDDETEVVHCDAQLGQDSFREMSFTPLPPIFQNILQMKIDELKETTGNRDFSNGGTTSGVTSAAAISALQMTGGKLSRDMIQTSYRAFTKVCYLIIELIRQFYDYERTFRITGDNGSQFVTFSNAGMVPQPQGVDFGMDMGYRMPIFDIKVSAEKESPYSRLSNNELAIQFYQLGFFNPMNADVALAAISMMKFEGKEQVIEQINQNRMMMAQQMMPMPQQPTGNISTPGQTLQEKTAEMAAAQATPR